MGPEMSSPESKTADEAGEIVCAFYHAGIAVSDIDRSLAFYRDLLGFEQLSAWETDADYVQELVGAPGATLNVRRLRLPGTEAELELVQYEGVERVHVSGRPRDPGQGHIGLYVKGLDLILERARALGLRPISAGPVTSKKAGREGTRVAYLPDPDGHWVELLEENGP
jgi:catechol 2,3-dioxygenase-like lactoylglutathione lyase family enzyme